MLALTAELGAQTVNGRVVDSATSGPLVGVVVALVDSAGAVIGRALTNSEGSYHLSARPGRFRMRVLRIGFLPHTSPALELRPGEAIRRDMLVVSRPIRLDTVRVVSRTPCARLASSPAAHAVWEQARNAIAATLLSSTAPGYEATMVLHEQKLSTDLRTVQSFQANLWTGRTRQLWHTLSADSIEKVGYVIPRGSGATYHGPNLEYLISESFAAHHCFRLSRATGDSIGVAFEPTRERHVPEVRGTVWLDDTTAELRSLSFVYTNVGKETESVGAGGEMRFSRLANGGWAIAHWALRAPVLERRPVTRLDMSAGTVRQGTGFEWHVTQVQTGGGELAVVVQGGDTVFRGRPRPVTGAIVDAASGRGLPHAQIWITAAGAPIGADATGRFVGPALLPGRYDVTALTPAGPAVVSTVEFVGPELPVTVRIASSASVKAGVAPSDSTSRSATLDTVRVTSPAHVPSSAVVDERPVRRSGQVLDAAELRRNDGRALVDVLRTTFQGLAIQSTGGAQYLYSRTAQGPGALRGNRLCYVQVVMDGMPVSRSETGGGVTPYDLSGLLTRDFTAVEYFRDVASTPAEYRSAGASCGTVVLWSTRR